MDIWRLSNTGVRNPLRIQDGLKAYSRSTLIGNIRSREKEIELGNYLAKEGILSNKNDPDGTYGRKWRFAWNIFGYTVAQVKNNWGFNQENIGDADSITPLGKALISADTFSAVQECFLRAMSVHMFEAGDGNFFSPLRWTLKVLLEVERRTGSASVNFNEFAIFIQTSDPTARVELIVSNLLALREQKEKSSAKKIFDRKAYAEAKIKQGYGYKAENYKEYGDMNIRYLRASGIFQRKGRGIAIVPEHHSLAVTLASEQFSNQTLLERLRLLYNIPPLPTDSIEGARDALISLTTLLKSRGIIYDISQYKLDTVADINNARMSLQSLLDINNEIKYADEQRNKWEEITDYMELVMHRGGSKTYDDGSEIVVPKDEAAAYLEWVIWRSFLAIDHLANKPYQVRSFNIDQDFFPVNTAGGGKADLVAEFDDCVICGEVTLSSSSRQEAMEGEPVRRHVADLIEAYDKPVYGLFVANSIDTNTAETFKTGIWYLKDDTRIDLRIVPLTLNQFNLLFRQMFESGNISPKILIDLILACSDSRRNLTAPEWKVKINNIVSEYAYGGKIVCPIEANSGYCNTQFDALMVAEESPLYEENEQ
ncbi:AlwI family type II restriction endonuclease [bacterium]|nr:AlwI family type II restriction endonuclease [bacterium]